MQFIVFAACALVLSVPRGGPPWATVTSPLWTWLIIVGQIAMPALIAAVYARWVLRKLEREPAWLPSAQRRLAQGNTALRGALVVGLLASLYLTDWAAMVRGWPIVGSIFGLDELIMLAPFFLAIVVAWIVLYPADRAVRQVSLELRLWASAPTRPVWGMRAYLSFMLRHHVLIIFVPMAPIVAANDFVNKIGYQIRQATGLAWADQALLVLIAGLVFLAAPVMLRAIWHTRPLPPGPLRARLEELCRRIGLTYRAILIWESDGMVVNAAVMGIFRPVRYILLSDGLLEMMDDQRIEAVFGHEAGHIKQRHMQFYLLFAVLSMLIVGGMTELVVWQWPELLRNRSLAQDYLQVAAMVLIVLVWLFGFGVVSRRFEWQSDLFGVRSVTPAAEECNQPCLYHGTAVAVGPAPQPSRSQNPVCATGVGIFADALHRIAVLNGIPVEARSWRHSSIANRIRLLKSYACKPQAAAQLERAVLAIKAILLVGTWVGLGIGLWLYWPQPGTR